MVKEFSNDPYEDFFILQIKNGFVSLGKELSQSDIEVLLMEINPENEKKLESFFKEQDKMLWNNYMVEALRVAFNDRVRDYPELKKFEKDAGVIIDHPTVQWSEMFDGLYKNSQKIVSGVVQNWYFTYFKTQARESITKSGCLLSIASFAVIITLLSL